MSVVTQEVTTLCYTGDCLCIVTQVLHRWLTGCSYTGGLLCVKMQKVTGLRYTGGCFDVNKQKVSALYLIVCKLTESGCNRRSLHFDTPVVDCVQTHRRSLHLDTQVGDCVQTH